MNEVTKERYVLETPFPMKEEQRQKLLEAWTKWYESDTDMPIVLTEGIKIKKLSEYLNGSYG